MEKGKLTFYTDLKQKSQEWKDLKVGRASGSQAIGLTTKARLKTYVIEKLTEIATGELPFVFVNKAMARGNEKEPEARDLYEVLTGNDVTEVGAVANSNYPYGLLSPDGLIGTEGALEIKSPNSSTHMKTLLGGIIPVTNIAQVTWYFVILEDIQWLDFMSFDDRVPDKPYFLTRVTREGLKSEIDEMKKMYKLFEKGLMDGLNQLADD